jgi:hypothetical protein
MMDKEWFSVLDVEKKTGIPNQTLRRYISVHGHHLNVKKQGKGYYLADEAVKVIQEIRKLYEGGLTSQQVNDSLVEKAIPMIVNISEGEQKVSIHVGEALQELRKTLDEQNKAIRSQNELINSLAEQIQKQQEYIDNKLEERDQKLMAAIRENQEAKKQVAVSQEKKKSWISRLFQK